MGDWGCGEDTCKHPGDRNGAEAGGRQEKVAQAMGQAAQAIDSKIVMALGDNFYWGGVKSVSDPLWQSVWQVCFYARVCNVAFVRCVRVPVCGMRTVCQVCLYA